MQSRRVRLPRLVGPLRLPEALARVGGGDLAVADPGAPALAGTVVVGADASARPAVRGVAVGPEGGWTHDELAAFDRRVGLPGGILRTETAAVAAGTLLVASRGDSGD